VVLLKWNEGKGNVRASDIMLALKKMYKSSGFE